MKQRRRSQRRRKVAAPVAVAQKVVGSPSARSPRWLLGLGGVVVLAHLALVATLLCQPLAINENPDAYRSPIWPLHNDTIHRIGPGADFFAVYHAGQALSAGLDPYASVEPIRVTPYWFPFRYLPFVGQTLGRVAASFAPLTAYRIWLLLIEAMLVLFAVAVIRRYPSSWRRHLALGVLLLSSPYGLELHMGQFTFVTVVAVVLAMMVLDGASVSAKSRLGIRRAGAALAYTAALLLKLFPLAAAPAMVRDRRCWPVLLVALSTLAVVLVHDFGRSASQLATFWQLNVSAPLGGMDGGNMGVVYALYLALRDHVPAWHAAHWDAVRTGLRLGILGITCLVVLISRSKDVMVGVPLLLLAHFVSYTHVWEHHMSAMIVLGVVLLIHEPRARDATPLPRERWVAVSAAVALLLLALPTPFGLLDQEKNPAVFDPTASWSAAARYLLVSSKALPTLMLFLVALRMQLRRGLSRPSLRLSREIT